MSFYSFKALKEGLKHLWSAVWLVDGGGVANDINDAAELHQAAEQAGQGPLCIICTCLVWYWFY